jgi:hypothetical protein
MKKQEEREELQAALATIEKLAPKIYSVLKKGFYRIVCDRRTDLEQIGSAVKIYLHAKGIHLTPRVIELLVMFVKYDTSTASRKKIARQINMTRVAINQNVIALKKAGLIIYPYEDTKKSVVHEDLIKLKKYIIDNNKSDILVTYVDNE